MLTYGSDTTLFGFSSTSQQFFMLGSGANANLKALGGGETDAQLSVGELQPLHQL